MRLPPRSLSFLAGAVLVLAGTALASSVVPSFVFPDVKKGTYFTDSVTELVRKGILKGYDDGRFGPDDPVTRAQVSVMLDRYDREVVEPLREQLRKIREILKLGACGDGIVQIGEECDDENIAENDGCSATCQSEVHERPETALLSHGATWVCYDDASSSGEGACRAPAAWWEEAQKFCSAHCSSDSGKCGVNSFTSGAMCAPGETGEQKEKEKKKHCEPHVCADGTTVPSCTTDGNPINYFADPCLSHEKSKGVCGNGICEPKENPLLSGKKGWWCPEDCEAQSACGNGICEKGEPNDCPACLQENPPCLAVCLAGTCPEDCVQNNFAGFCGNGICDPREGLAVCDPLPDGSGCEGYRYCPADCREGGPPGPPLP